MPIECTNCPDHGKLVVEIEHLQESIKESNKTMKELNDNVNNMKTDMIKLESREKMILAIFAFVGTIVSTLGSVVGCLITAYVK
jgi:hypothetical protein